MRHRSTALGVAMVVLLALPTALAGLGLLAPEVRGASTTPVTGSITGPTLVSVGTTSPYSVYGWGGPAVELNGTNVGTVVGNLTYYSSLVGSNLTGVSFSPARGSFTENKSLDANLTVANATESVTIDVMVSSVFQGKNESTNFTYTVNVVRPYVLTATIVNVSSAAVAAFTVIVTLDGTTIGNVSVPAIPVGGSYGLTFTYPTRGLASGDHTFAISLTQEHGLVTFANGLTSYSDTVYITGPAPDYTIWYVFGIVAFFGALFIFATRVAARRRGAARR